MKSVISVVLLPLVIISFSCCKKGNVVDIDEWSRIVKQDNQGLPSRLISIKDSVDFDWPDDSLLRKNYPGVETAIRRARQLVELKWTPYANVPSCYGFYSGLEEQKGAPYSLAYMTNTQLGTQVSIHTFMTALQNPYSVLYTEDLRDYPYNGSTGSSIYYGTTCSNSVMYVLGIEPPYYTGMIGIIPGMKKTREQTPESIELCDVLWKTGHIMMVYDIDRNEDGAISQVCIFETTTNSQKDTWIKNRSFNDFVSYWNRSGVVRYKYAYLDRNTDYHASVFVPLEDEIVYPFRYNYEICPTLGDRCSYLEGRDVHLAVLSDYYHEIVLYKDGIEYCSVNAERPITTISGLPYGEYRVCLVRDETRSGYAYFEVVDAQADAKDEGKQIRISFSSNNASARYVSICNKHGSPYNYYIFNDSDRESGAFCMNRINSNAATHYQVFFHGRYGVVATDVKHL